jgi:hypothetical protein
VKGLLTNLANPKAIIYFGSVFSLFVGDSVGAGARWGIFLLIVETSPGLPSWQACSPYRRCAVATSVWRSGLTACRRAVRRLRHPSDHFALSMTRCTCKQRANQHKQRTKHFVQRLHLLRPFNPRGNTLRQRRVANHHDDIDTMVVTPSTTYCITCG